ncbi:uncharacterized protein LOC143227248 [Tachypleus tridentatus]|uniref:uncharacterized protein LOC143227248 n=1 Tax=Tachypleus tridentatus TaxID=6853 RepID=UPI003FD11B97
MLKQFPSVTTGSILMKTCIFVLLLWPAQGFVVFDEDKRQDLVPFPRVGRSFWSWTEDKRQGLVPFPRVGRSTVKRQGLIPFPRIGRSYSFPQDDIVDDIENTFDKELLYTPSFKRFSSEFTPRLGRKKRSVVSSNDDTQDRDYHSWYQGLSPYENHFHRNLRQLVPAPRLGRAFTPLIGSQTTHPSSSFHNGEGENKRSAFTPRIGRDPITPRVGRSEGNIGTNSHGAFAPRIGRTAFTPRLGRSHDHSKHGKEIEA